MEVTIDPHAGYCFGVVKAIQTAEAELQQGGPLYCIGDIVHNSAEVHRLEAAGLQVIDHSRLASLRGERVLIRAHGEPPETYRLAKSREVELVDATCPIVLALQQRIRQGYEEMKSCRGQIVIFGKPGHAEVIGLNGQTENTAIIISHPDQYAAVDLCRPIRLYSQTTKSREEYRQLIDLLRSALPQEANFVAYDTICNRVANRAHQLEAFAREVDVLLFVAGGNSSNGRYLYEYCRKVQPETYFISDATGIPHHAISATMHVGVSGATSTPRWLMEEVAQSVQNHHSNNSSL